MNPCMFRSMLISATLLSFAVGSQAQQAGPETKAVPVAGKAKAKSPKPPKAKLPIEQLVDINNAAKPDLKKLPGVTDAIADKIVAGRPYRSKANLVTHNILPHDLYTKIKGLVYARQNPAAK